MATFNIPEIGTEITLAEDWQFNLFNEQRNNSLFERKNIKTNRTPDGIHFKNYKFLAQEIIQKYKEGK